MAITQLPDLGLRTRSRAPKRGARPTTTSRPRSTRWPLWEILRQIAEDAIRPFYDETLAERTAQLQTKWEDRATAWLIAQPPYADAGTKITEARQAAEAAADALDDAQRLAIENLQAALTNATDAPEPPDDPIEPEITATAPEPLFTSTDSFATASRKLIDRKCLVSMDDEGAP